MLNWETVSPFSHQDINAEPLLHEAIWPRTSLAIASFFSLIDADERDPLVLLSICRSVIETPGFDSNSVGPKPEAPADTPASPVEGTITEPATTGPNTTKVIQHPDFDLPQDVAMLPSGNFLVSDREKGGLHLLANDGSYLRIVGTEYLTTPMGMSVNRDGSIAVCDFNHGLVFLTDFTFVEVAATAKKFQFVKHAVEVGSTGDILITTAMHPLCVLPRGSADEPVPLTALCESIKLSKAGVVGFNPVTGLVYVAENSSVGRRDPCRLFIFAPDESETLKFLSAINLTDPAGVPLGAMTTFDGIVFHPTGDILLTETGGRRLLRIAMEYWADDKGKDRLPYQACFGKVKRASGKVVHSYGAKGTEPGEFNFPVGCVLLPYNRVIVADRNNARLQVLKL